MTASGFARLESRFSQDGRSRTYEADFQVRTDSRDDGPQIVRAYAISQMPPGTEYQFGNDYDPGCFAKLPKSIRLKSVDKSAKLWIVTIPFANWTTDQTEEEDFDNPLDEPYKISGSFVRGTKAATKDKDGNPLANSADEPWIPAPEIDDNRDTLIIEGNAANIDLAIRGAAKGKVNDAELWGLDARAVKLCQWSWSVEYYAGALWYIRNRLEFEIDTNLWNEVRLDEGFRIKNGVDGDGNTVYTQLMDDQDQPLRNPRLLDGSGGLLAAADPPVEIEKEVIDEYDFTKLPIPLNIEFAS